MDKIIQLIEYIPTKPLSEILPSVLTLALESKDYKGYCVLSFFMYPMSPSAKTNNIHKNELIKILTLEGISKEDIITIVNESIEDYLEIKTVSEDAISSHSVKEIEIWLHNSKPLLDIDSNIVNKSYVDLSERKIQLEKMYEFMRSYTFSKLTYYQQFLGKSKNEPIKQEKIKAFIKAVPSKIFIVHGHNGENELFFCRHMPKFCK